MPISHIFYDPPTKKNPHTQQLWMHARGGCFGLEEKRGGSPLPCLFLCELTQGCTFAAAAVVVAAAAAVVARPPPSPPISCQIPTWIDSLFLPFFLGLNNWPDLIMVTANGGCLPCMHEREGGKQRGEVTSRRE